MNTILLDARDPQTPAVAAELIRRGRLVAIPTETVYGLGADGLNPEAVAKIFEAKGRPQDNPLIIHVTGAQWLPRYCADVPPLAYVLARKFWPGPLTMILKRRPIIPDETTAGLDTVAVRCPNHPVTLAIIREAGIPIAAPSANLSGRPSCTTAQDVLELLWRCQGRITHLELFNLREWNEGQLRHVTAINTLQRAINEGSTPRLKHVIRRIVHDEPAQSPRQALFQTILGQLPQLREWYALAPLGSRIGTDSTSSSHHTHGMGLVFVETLPPKARAVLQRERNTQRLTLPVHTDIYRFVQHHEPPQPQPWWQKALRRLPGLGNLGCQSVRGWGLEKTTTSVGRDGNLVTLGGVDNRGISRDAADGNLSQEEAWTLPRALACCNSTLANFLKILAGFLAAQWAFWYVDGWWVLTWFGALTWFAITAVRNVAQSVVGGGAFTRSLLLPWKRFVSWGRMADSLLYTGLSVPLLEVGVRLWLLQDLLGVTVATNPLVVYTVIALVNSAYISGHNLFRGLPREAVIGNLFRSALSIPLSVLLGQGLLGVFTLLALPNPLALLQNCAAIVAKCASDMVAAVIEGFADRNVYLRLRQCDYDSKLRQIYANLTRQELLFPHRDLEQMLEHPESYWQQLFAKDPAVAREAVAHLLDMLYMWYYQPRARQVFWRKMRAAPPEERGIVLGLHALLGLERQVSTLILNGLLEHDFARALAFYLQNNRSYLRDLRADAAQKCNCPDACHF